MQHLGNARPMACNCVVQAEMYADADALHNRSHPILKKLAQRCTCAAEYYPTARLMRSLLHPCLSERATLSEATAADYFS